MVSDASKKKAAQKKAAAAAKRGGKAASSKSVENGSSKVDSLASGVEELHISDRTCTGVLCSHPMSRDIRVRDLDLIFFPIEFDLEFRMQYVSREILCRLLYRTRFVFS